MNIKAKFSTSISILLLLLFVSGIIKAQDIEQISVKKWADDKKSAFSFTFDDGCMSQYTYAAPLLDSFKFKGTFSVVGGFMTENLPGVDRYGTWTQFRSMALEGHEVGSHSMSHPDLTLLAVGDTGTAGTLVYELYQSQKKIEQEISSQKCITLTYPNLNYDTTVEINTSRYYQSARTGGRDQADASLAGLEFYRLPAAEELFNLPRNSPADDLDELADIEKYTDTTIRRGNWGLLEIHEVVPFAQIPQLVINGEWYPMSTEWLSALCQYMKQKSDSSQIWVETMGNVTRYMRERQVFQWDILTQTETQMTIHGYDTLDNQIYNYPLTVDILVPSDWESVIVNQGSRTDTVHAFSGDSINFYVRAHVIPDGGIITLDKMFSILTLSALIEGLYKDTIMVPDTITVELRSSISPYTMVDSRIGVLDSAGVGTFTFTAIKNNVPYYLIIKHRNALETWSSIAHSFNSFTLSYDFTSSQSQAYGNNLILKGGKYCVYSGDVNQDGLVDLTDLITIDNDNENYITGFAVTDINGDGLVDLSDLIIVDNNILNFVSKQVPPGASTIKNIKSHQLPKTVNN